MFFFTVSVIGNASLHATSLFLVGRILRVPPKSFNITLSTAGAVNSDVSLMNKRSDLHESFSYRLVALIAKVPRLTRFWWGEEGERREEEGERGDAEKRKKRRERMWSTFFFASSRLWPDVFTHSIWILWTRVKSSHKSPNLHPATVVFSNRFFAYTTIWV